MKIAENCTICKRTAGALRRFKITVGSGELRFNHDLHVDTMFIKNRPVLQLVDLGTHFCDYQILKSQTSSEFWRTIAQIWSLVYLGPPEVLSVDPGTNFISEETRFNCHSSGVRLKGSPIKTPGAIGTVERYHSPLPTA